MDQLKGHTQIAILTFILTVILAFFIISSGSNLVASQSSEIDLTDEHDLENFSVKISSQNIENFSNSGQQIYDVTVSGQLNRSDLPILYPVTLTYYDTGDQRPTTISQVDSNKDQYTRLADQTVFLTPTSPDSFVPNFRNESQDTGKELEMKRSFRVNIAFDDLIDVKPSNIEEKNVVVLAESRRSTDTDGNIKQDNRDFDSNVSEVRGKLPAGIDQSQLETVQTLNVPSGVTYVDSFRITDSISEAGFQEDTSLPSLSGDTRLNGRIEGFNGMQVPTEGSASIIGEQGFNMITRTGSIPSGSPKLLAVTYTITGGENISINVLDPAGKEIVQGTDYHLPAENIEQDPRCRENVNIGSETANMCLFYLSSDEIDTISSLGEMFVHYGGSDDTRANIYCQSLTTGYLSLNGEMCGVSSNQDETVRSGSSSFIEVQGRSSSTSNWQTSFVGVSSSDNSTQLRLRPGTLSQDISDVEHTVYLFERNNSNILEDTQGGLSSDIQILDSFNFTAEDGDYQRNSDNWVEYGISDTDFAGKSYGVIMCDTSDSVPEDCNLGSGNNEDYQEINFRIQSINTLDLRINEPILFSDLTQIGINEQFVIDTETIQTTDDSYHFDNNTIYDWQQSEQVESNFTGKIRQTIRVDDVYQNDIDEEEYKIGDTNSVYQKAVKRRSEPEGISADGWNVDNIQVVEKNKESIYLPADVERSQLSLYVDQPSKWQKSPSTTERTVQSGQEREFFDILDGDTFRSRVESQSGWYPVRGDDAGSAPTSTYTFETRTQRVNPGKCLNCLPTENVSQAEQRLEDSVGTSINGVVGTPDISQNSWRLESSEPVNIIPAEETGYSFYRSGSPTGDPLIYHNIGPSEDRLRYRFRASERNFVDVYRWSVSDTIDQTEFERPLNVPVQKYEKTEYEVVYDFSADISTGTELYEYERDITEDQVEYEEGNIAWIDVSDSIDSNEIDEYTVQFEGSNEGITVDWVQDVHSNPPYDRQQSIEQYCDTSTTNYDNPDGYPVSESVSIEDTDDIKRLTGTRSGTAGPAVIQTCNVNGEEKIVRVGQELTRTGEFAFDIEMISGIQSDTNSGEIYVQSDQDDTTSAKSAPRIQDIELINEKVDYNVGTIPITGQIRASAQNLDSTYEIVVSPADSVDVSSVSCSEFSGYRQSSEDVLTSKYNSGDTIRQIEECVQRGFVEPDAVPQEFKIYNRSVSPTGTVTEQAYEIPSGAIQRCLSPLDQNGDKNNCVASGSLDGLSSDYAFDIGTAEQWNSIPPAAQGEPALGYNCPQGYTLNTNTQTLEDETVQETYKCSLNSDSVQFELRTRSVSYVYESVSGGIVETCENIPVVGEGSNAFQHEGYVTVDQGDNTKCQLVDQNDPGPNNFTFSTTDVDNLGNKKIEYKDLPPGAFRGYSYTADTSPDRCVDTRVETDGSLICNYEKSSGEQVEVRYGTRLQGEWTASSDNVVDLMDQSDTKKVIWQSDYIVPDNGEYVEQFTETINPRQTGFKSTKDKIDFTVELRNSETGEIKQSRTFTVDLCAMPQSISRSNILQSTTQQNQCENFDTLGTGTDDYISDFGIDDAIQDYTERGSLSSTGSVEYEISSIKNDLCVYSTEYPRNRNVLLENTNGQYNVTVNADSQSELASEKKRIRKKILKLIQPQYSISGDNICAGSVSYDGSIPTPTEKEQDVEKIIFNRTQFVNDTTNNFVRTAGLQDLHQVVPNPVQSRWRSDDLGGSLRLGTPILSDNSGSYTQNQNLVSHYTFDHDPTQHLTITEHSSPNSQETKYTIPNHYVVQDVAVSNTQLSPDGTSDSFLIDDAVASGQDVSEGIHNARVWFGTSCNIDSRTDDGQIVNPEFLQPINGVGPDRNSFAYQDCGNSLSATSAMESLSNSSYAVNEIANNPSEFPDSYQDVYGSGISRLTENTVANQSAHLPVPPTQNTKEKYNGQSHISDSYEYLDERYNRDGLFAGNSLHLDQNTWLMMTPPCQARDLIEEGVKVKSLTESQDCSGSILDNWNGGFSNSYTDVDQQISNSIYSELDGSYTISFWVNTEDQVNSIGSTDQYSDSNLAPNRNLYSSSIPASGGNNLQSSYSGGPDYMLSSMQLNIMKTPISISLDGISTEEKQTYLPLQDQDSGTYELENRTYPGYINFVEVAKSCMNSTYTTSNPVQSDAMCTIFELSDSQYAGTQVDERYDDLEEFSIEDDVKGSSDIPVFIDDFRKEMIQRMNWRLSYNWPIGSSVSNTDGYAFENDQRPTNTVGNSNWQHITIAYGSQNTDVYINGDKKSSPESVFNLTSGQNRETIDTGKIYENGVVSIGAVYQDAGYNLNSTSIRQDGFYRPYIQSTKGDMKIDELRVYDTKLSPTEISNREIPQYKTATEHDIGNQNPMYTGEIETGIIRTDAKGDNIGTEILDGKTYRSFNVNIDAKSDGPGGYNANIIPCGLSPSGVKCVQSASENVVETAGMDNSGVLSGKSASITFNDNILQDQGISEIVGFKLDIELGSPTLGSSPVIKNITLDPSGSVYDSCQDIAERHPGNSGLYGSIFTTEIVDQDGDQTEVKCDMKHAGGEWTTFAWMDKSNGTSYGFDTSENSLPITDQMSLSDCDVDDRVCFSPADFDGSGQPQILIKAIDNGGVVEWSAFELNPDAHDVPENDLGIDSVRQANDLVSIFEGTSEVAGDPIGSNQISRSGPTLEDDSEALETDSEPTDGSYATLRFPECLHPFSNSGSFNGQCISHVASTGFSGESDPRSRLVIDEWSLDRFSSNIIGQNQEYKMIDWVRNNEQQEIKKVQCLGQSVDRCEIAYRTGDAFE